jgi:suppressor of cytokine signaling 2
MCIKSIKLSPGEDQSMASKPASTLAVVEKQQHDKNREKREKKERYQNVTLAGTPLLVASHGGDLAGSLQSTSSSQIKGSHSQSGGLFLLEDKKAESQNKNGKHHDQSWHLSERTIVKQASDSSSMTSSTTSMLSGGCAINLMAASTENQVITVHHHHHHHFKNNKGKITTLTTSSPSIPVSNPTFQSTLGSKVSVALSKAPLISPSQIKSTPTVSKTLTSELRNHQVNQNFYVNINYIHQCLTLNKYLLEQCSFYYGAMNWSQSTELLKNTSEGTFLVRDSSDSRFLFTLSVQRTPEDGPTSVRIHFANGKFYLDADEQIEDLMPKFDSVLDLVNHYSNLSQNNCAKSHIWIDNKGHFYSPICLKKPLKKDVPTLSHVARLAIHQSMESQDLLPELNLPTQINNFLVKYPHVM